MEFIKEGDFFLVYWDMVTIYSKGVVISDKKPGIPEHVWAKIPDDITPHYVHYVKGRQKSTTA